MSRSLGDLTFDWEPEQMTPAESKKTVAKAVTYGGAEIFQWAAEIQGEEIILEWGYVPNAQYASLREKYLSMDAVVFSTGDTDFNVIVTDLTSEYLEIKLDDEPYRKNVKLTLSIISEAT